MVPAMSHPQTKHKRKSPCELMGFTSKGAENMAMMLIIGSKRSARFWVTKDKQEPLSS